MTGKSNFDKIKEFNSKLDIPQKIIRNIIISLAVDFIFKITKYEN